jgi:hypothetical protein
MFWSQGYSYYSQFTRDIVYGTMNRRKLDKLGRELIQMRRSQQKAAALESIARRLGRRTVKRGKEPMWVNREFPALFPLAIPHHGGKDLPIGTRNSVLDQLEDDVLAWDEALPTDDDQKSKNGEDDGTGTDGEIG